MTFIEKNAQCLNREAVKLLQLSRDYEKDRCPP